MRDLLDIVRRLRAPDGCPWDRRQTHASLRPYLLEEAAEAVDALEHDAPEAVVGELGDVLLQVALHAVIAEEEGAYDYRAIEAAVVAKMIRRHPHVFGDARADDEAAVVARWEELKTAERGGAPRPAAERVPRALPALARAARLSEALGWEAEDGAEALTAAEVADRPERLGAALLALVEVARRHRIDPELALRDHLERQARRTGGSGATP